MGILQEANTDELIVGYRSVDTVFQVTFSLGASQSLSRAEKSLKERNITDDLYYDAYLKPYSTTYTTTAGQVTKDVRMRDCHVILMVNNLV
jgi:hypothetical protein